MTPLRNALAWPPAVGEHLRVSGEAGVEEICDHFAGDWQITEMQGYSEIELHAGEPARITFWEDGRGELVCGGENVTINVRYGETFEGLSAVTFKGRRSEGAKRAAVSGLGAIKEDEDTIEGSAKVGGRARGFVAKRLP